MQTTDVSRLLVLSRDRSRTHIERRLYHMGMGLTCFSLYAFILNRVEALWTLLIVGGPFVLFDVLRFYSPQLNELTLRLFGNIMRREELRRVSGNTFFIIGLILVTLFFPKPIVLLSVFYLAVGDPVAAIVGTMWGRHKLPGGRKSIEGALANFSLSALGTFVFAVSYLKLSPAQSCMLAGVGGTASVIAEALPLPIDDNFTIPVVSAGVLAIAFYFLPFV